MAAAVSFTAKVISAVWLTPSVLQLRFEPSRKIPFEGGQFLSIQVPQPGGGKPLRRIYSFATGGPEQGYELCIKNVDGPGTRFLCSLRPGDEFKASGPYGDFLYQPRPGRNACFIATGTGVAPLKAMAESKLFLREPPEATLLVFGARTEDEIIYPGLFEAMGFRVVNAISRPGPRYAGFHGRVTDFLRSLPVDWAWHSTDFYLCGNGEMVAEARRLLRHGHNVAPESVIQEVYFTASDRQASPEEKERRTLALIAGGRR